MFQSVLPGRSRKTAGVSINSGGRILFNAEASDVLRKQINQLDLPWEEVRLQLAWDAESLVLLALPSWDDGFRMGHNGRLLYVTNLPFFRSTGLAIGDSGTLTCHDPCVFDFNMKVR